MPLPGESQDEYVERMRRRDKEFQEWRRENVTPEDIRFTNRQSHVGRNIHFALLLSDKARGWDDNTLISLADGGTFHFGGRVERHPNRTDVAIHVYTD